MNPQITPEIRSALEQHPVGPIRLDGDAEGGPVYLVRLDDLANLQELIDGRVRDALGDADDDIAAGRIVDWNPGEMKRLGRERSSGFDQS
ncbi:hypothetical protein [Roseiconus lacunae]|uniref:hypothetical protein n=1 Tax=Roseiconus lacunae TaxID=2605694 RepID=UPI001E4391DE|nr:hypothetical protein [Roseiconus lacunae]MCD0461424.1 hypothetical protein [Roseiconus lacunae]